MFSITCIVFQSKEILTEFCNAVVFEGGKWKDGVVNTTFKSESNLIPWFNESDTGVCLLPIHTMATIRTLAVVSAVVASLAALLYRPVRLRVQVLGVSRPLDKIQNIHGQDLGIIPDSLYCEDLHHHIPSNLLFAASEENAQTRWKWFPPYVLYRWIFKSFVEIYSPFYQYRQI